MAAPVIPQSEAGSPPTPEAGRLRPVDLLLDLLTLLYFLFALFPLFWIFLLSLKTQEQLFTTYFRFDPTLDGYKTVLGLLNAGETVPFMRYFLNSLITAGVAVLVSFRFAPELMVIIPLYIIYNRIGLLDSRTGLIWVFQLITLPLIVWILRSYFQDLTPELEQSALLDGYSRTQAFVKVVLPLVKPGLAAASLLAFIFAWNSF